VVARAASRGGAAAGAGVLALAARRDRLTTLRCDYAGAWPAIRPRLGGLIVGGAVGVGLFSYLLLGGAYQSLAIEVGFINATTPVWVAAVRAADRRRSA